MFSDNENETGVGKIVRLTLNLMDNEIYWFDAGNDLIPKKIGSVKMDGTQARILVSTELGSIGSIRFHERSRRVYWSDVGRKKIESVSVDSVSDRMVVVSDAERPFAFTLWDLETDTLIYYADQIQEQLVAMSLKSGEKRILKSNTPIINQLRIYRKPVSQRSSACLNNNGGCHQICVPSGSTGRQCRCGNGLELQSDGSCRPFQKFILYSSSKLIRAIPLDPISDTEALPIISGNQIGKVSLNNIISSKV